MKNLGVVGFGAIQSIYKAHVAETYFGKPKATIFLCGGDYEDDNNIGFDPKSPSFSKANHAEPLFSSIVLFPFRNSQLICLPFAIQLGMKMQGQYELKRYHGILPKERTADVDTHARTLWDDLIEQYPYEENRTVVALSEYAKHCKVNDIDFYVVILMCYASTESFEIGNWAKSIGVNLVLFLPTRDEIIEGEGHLSAKGNEALAKVLASRLSSQ